MVIRENSKLGKRVRNGSRRQWVMCGTKCNSALVRNAVVAAYSVVFHIFDKLKFVCYL